MIFYLTDELSDLIETKAIDTVLPAFENLARAYFEGKHIILGDKDILFNLSENPSLSLIAKSTYRKILKYQVQFLGLIKIAQIYLSIEKQCFSRRTINHLNQTVIHVPLHSFRNSTQIQESLFICENLNDCKIYHNICKAFMFKKHISKISLRYHEIGGGGNTCHEQYSRENDHCDRLCFSILDSDKYYPDCEIGDTAKFVQNADCSDCCLTAYYIVSCREIENILSSKQLEDLCGKDVNRMASLEFIENLENSEYSKYLWYIDFKNGFEIKFMANLVDEVAIEFWNKFTPFLKNIKKDCEYLNKNSCHDNNCICKIFPGFGSNLLVNIISLFENKTPQKISEGIAKAHKEEWERLGIIFFSWTCASPKTFI